MPIAIGTAVAAVLTPDSRIEELLLMTWILGLGGTVGALIFFGLVWASIVRQAPPKRRRR